MRGKNRQQRKAGEGKAVRPRRSAVSRVFMSLFLLAIAGVIGAGVFGFAGYSTFTAQGPLEQAKIFEVEKGLGTPEIAAVLKTNGIISDEKVFTTAALITGDRGRLKAGEYEFPAHASMRDVMRIIATGQAILYKLTIPEGWTTEMALERVRENEVLTGDLSLAPGEGEVLPETYLFKRGKSRDDLVKEMTDAQAKLLEELWASRGSNGVVKSPREAVILASIVEKETGVPEERPEVAAVFFNRLKKNMRLQSDPTIIYGLAGGKGKLDRPLTKADITSKTPYNTYEISGLPPGPIANPGREAIEAVLNPASSKALYFVADGTGGHAFAETLAEHNANVQKWRGIEKNRIMVEAMAESTSAPEAQADPAAAAPETTGQTQLPDMNAEKPADATAPTAPAQETASTETPAATVAVPAESAEKAAQPAEASAEPAAEAEIDRKPGDVVKIANRLVPIPVPKPKRP